MKSNHLFFYLGPLFLALSASFSCSKDRIALRDTHPLLDSLEFEFRLLNEQGIPSTTFREGENFVFSFLIINNSNQKFSMERRIDDTTNFFRVYKINAKPAEVDQEVLDMGKPYRGIFCFPLISIGIHQDTTKFEIPWNALGQRPGDPFYSSEFCLLEDHPPLEAGEYRTGFTSAFYFFKGEENFNTEEMTFNIEFEVVR